MKNKIKNIIAGLIGAAIVSVPSLAQAQTAYIPITPEYECGYSVGLLCYDTLDNGDKLIYMMVTHYGQWYMLAVQEYGPHNMMYVVGTGGEIVSQMMISDDLRAVFEYEDEMTADGNLTFMRSFSWEFEYLLHSRHWL